MGDQHRRQAEVIRNSIACHVEAMGMVAENDARKEVGASIAYREADFQQLLFRWGITDPWGRIMEIR